MKEDLDDENKEGIAPEIVEMEEARAEAQEHIIEVRQRNKAARKISEDLKKAEEKIMNKNSEQKKESSASDS